MSARAGANSKGIASIKDTHDAACPSSTTITRFNVPVSRTIAIPVESWNIESRNSRPSDSSDEAASAKGSHRRPKPPKRRAALPAVRIIVE